MSSVLLKLGDYKFSISTSAYDQLVRSTSYSWADQPVYLGRSKLHYTGISSDTVSLHCSQFPGWKCPLDGGYSQAEVMRTMAGNGVPYLMVSSTGVNLGRWVIESVNETQSNLMKDGSPMKVEFDLSLKRYE